MPDLQNKLGFDAYQAALRAKRADTIQANRTRLLLGALGSSLVIPFVGFLAHKAFDDTGWATVSALLGLAVVYVLDALHFRELAGHLV